MSVANPPVWSDPTGASVDVQATGIWTQAAVDAICSDLDYLGGNNGAGGGYTGVGGTYIKLGSTVVAVAAASVTFSSIPATFRHLRIEYGCRGDSVTNGFDALLMQLNGDTAAHYDYVKVDQTGSATTPADAYAQTSANIGVSVGNGSIANSFSAGVVDILNYANTTYRKSFRASGMGEYLSAAGGVWVTHRAGSWSGLAAVTSVTIFAATGNLNVGSHVQLYGLPG